jgi:hypothetical protein
MCLAASLARKCGEPSAEVVAIANDIVAAK